MERCCCQCRRVFGWYPSETRYKNVHAHRDYMDIWVSCDNHIMIITSSYTVCCAHMNCNLKIRAPHFGKFHLSVFLTFGFASRAFAGGRMCVVCTCFVRIDCGYLTLNTMKIRRMDALAHTRTLTRTCKM